jgi:hypothetical protein
MVIVEMTGRIQDRARRMTNQQPDQFYFDVALSFAGEDRQKAEELAEILRQRGIRVFYDRYEQADLWGKDLYEHLAEAYTEKAKYCVMFISEHYARKLWTNHERRNAQARAFRERREYILPLRLDDIEIPGIPATVGYLDLRHTTVEAVADILRHKLGMSNTASTEQAAGQAPPARKGQAIPLPSGPRMFSDLDRDSYLEEALKVIREYFRDGAAQLEMHQPSIKAKVLAVNAAKFVCRVYRDGDRLSECKIWVGGPMFRDAVSYVDGRFAIDDDSTLTDYVSVVDNGQELGLRLSNFWLGGWRPPQEVVTPEVAAEYLWRRFTSPLSQ